MIRLGLLFITFLLSTLCYSQDGYDYYLTGMIEVAEGAFDADSTNPGRINDREKLSFFFRNQGNLILASTSIEDDNTAMFSIEKIHIKQSDTFFLQAYHMDNNNTLKQELTTDKCVFNIAIPASEPMKWNEHVELFTSGAFKITLRPHRKINIAVRAYVPSSETQGKELKKLEKKGMKWKTDNYESSVAKLVDGFIRWQDASYTITESEMEQLSFKFYDNEGLLLDSSILSSELFTQEGNSMIKTRKGGTFNLVITAE